MKRSHPLIATWLLRRFLGANREAFVGDLEEQYSQGRSRLWYWRQTVLAIAVGTFTAVRKGEAMSFRALYSSNVLFRAALKSLAFVFVSFVAVFSASAGYGLLKTLFQALNSGANIGIAEISTHSGLTIAFLLLAGLSVYLAKRCFS